MQSLLVDAGPLIALIDRDDPWHAACRIALEGPDRLLTVWPAFSEAMYMVGKIGGQEQLFELVDRHAIGFASLCLADFPRNMTQGTVKPHRAVSLVSAEQLISPVSAQRDFHMPARFSREIMRGRRR